ncbi:putative membrane protein [Wickerhamomyces ciferrii]|uniref:Membrane protein n=1 Tax=Wickerhamomyces ciferrii (strain ATCC 14091 / BCRC 22168 / CBS 111 / JCM 3599 / NBRC 0793 / NRRL Y-1031 F-60-10) TaxID=1206466 RepID=K0KJS7_WICCF|nr:uncharacterized protein BN7_892 [Wickerhamomyces ciferrii]CCH41353.1 putative membrane protein [Wickerhamomyces ciferrii]
MGKKSRKKTKTTSSIRELKEELQKFSNNVDNLEDQVDQLIARKTITTNNITAHDIEESDDDDSAPKGSKLVFIWLNVGCTVGSFIYLWTSFNIFYSLTFFGCYVALNETEEKWKESNFIKSMLSRLNSLISNENLICLVNGLLVQILIFLSIFKLAIVQ